MTELTLERLGPRLWRLRLYRSGRGARHLVSTLEGSLGHVLAVAQRACVVWTCSDEARAMRRAQAGAAVAAPGWNGLVEAPGGA